MTQAAPPQAPTPAPAPDSAKKIVIIIVIVAAVVLLLSAIGGFLVYRAVKNANDQTSIEELSQTVSQLETYPQAYVAAGLPQYPEAQVINLSGNNATVEDSISIIITTSASQAEIAAYFDQQLTAAGWVAAPGQANPEEAVAFRTYSKDGQQYSLTSQSEEGSTTVTIFWGVEGSAL